MGEQMSDSTAAGASVITAARAAASSRRTSARFYVCVGLLLVSACTIEVTARQLGAFFRKEPAPLRKHLYQMDKASLAPEYDVPPLQPAPLDADTLDNLGTDEYLQWNLLDRRQDRGSPTYRARIFVTYYTGQPDMVPHRPEECMQASGWLLRGGRIVNIDVARPDGTIVPTPVNVLEFMPPASEAVGAPHGLYVLYFFVTNDKPIATREGVRASVKNLWDRYAYYSKLEFSFTDDSGRRLASEQESIEAATRLLNKLMPVLWNDHYPDWAALNAPSASR